LRSKSHKEPGSGVGAGADIDQLRSRVAEAEQRLKLLEAEHERLKNHAKSVDNVKQQVEEKKQRVAHLKEKIAEMEKERDAAVARNNELIPEAEKALQTSKVTVDGMHETLQSKKERVEALDKENELLYEYVNKQAEAIKILTEQLREADIEVGVKTDGEYVYLSQELRKRPAAKSKILERKGVPAITHIERKPSPKTDWRKPDRGPSQLERKSSKDHHHHHQHQLKKTSRETSADKTSYEAVEEESSGTGDVKNLFAMFESGKVAETSAKVHEEKFRGKEFDAPTLLARQNSSKGKHSPLEVEFEEEKKPKGEYDREAMFGGSSSGRNLAAMFESGAVAEASRKEHEEKFRGKEFDAPAMLARQNSSKGKHNPLAADCIPE